jgi:hypothetical protein
LTFQSIARDRGYARLSVFQKHEAISPPSPLSCEVPRHDSGATPTIHSSSARFRFRKSIWRRLNPVSTHLYSRTGYPLQVPQFFGRLGLSRWRLDRPGTKSPRGIADPCARNARDGLAKTGRLERVVESIAAFAFAFVATSPCSSPLSTAAASDATRSCRLTEVTLRSAPRDVRAPSSSGDAIPGV